MYYGQKDFPDSHTISSVTEALQQRTDAQAGQSFIDALRPNLRVYSEYGRVSYRAEIDLLGWWGNGDGDTPKEAIEAALLDMVEYREQVAIQRYLNKHDPYLALRHCKEYDVRGSR